MDRRTFVKLGSLTAVLTGAGTEALAQATKTAPKDKAPAKDAAKDAKAAQGPKLDEKDPQAVALGFVTDASKANKTKFPQYKPDQKCGNCQLYTGTGPTGACSIFGGKIVPTGGWCSAWVKKV